jgi:hypothetical protein
MGAHTESMIASIRIALSSLKLARAQLTAAKVPIAPAKVARDSAFAAMHKYYVAQGWDGQKATREQEMVSDQAYKVLEAKWEAAIAEVTKLERLLRAALGKVGAARQHAQTLVKVLDDYIKKKEVEKSWWQKTSVSSAKQFIVYAKAATA